MDGEARTSPVVNRLVAVVVLQWLGSTAVLPLLPLYLRNKGATPATTGVVMAAFFVGSLTLQYVAGHATDRYGRRPVLIAGLAGYALASLGLLLPLAPLTYGVLRFAQGGAAGSVEVATLGAVAYLVPEARRGAASSRIYSAMLAGASVGPFFGAFLGVREMGFVFVGAALLACAASVPVLRSDLGGRGDRSAPLPPLRVDRRLVGAVAVAISIGLTIGAYESCWTLLMRFDHATSLELGLTWTLFALPYVVCFRIGGWFADRADRRVLAAIGIVNGCAFCAIYPLLSVTGLLVFCCFEALGTSLALPAAASMLSEGADALSVGRRQGVFSTAQTAAVAVSAIVSGRLFEVGPAVPFELMALVGGLLVLAIPLAWHSVPGRVSGPVGATPRP